MSSGIVQFYNVSKRWGIIKTENGDYFTHQRYIEPDGLARRIIYANEIVEFTPSTAPPPRGSLPIAENVRPLNRPEESLAPDHREYGTVMSIMKGTHGYIARECEDSIFFRLDDVLTLGLEVGARVIFGIDKDEQGYRATNIEVFLPEAQ